MRNLYKVPKRQWRKWSETAKAVFNETYRTMINGWSVLFPPSLGKISKPARKVAAWNTAWIAADAVREAEKRAA